MGRTGNMIITDFLRQMCVPLKKVLILVMGRAPIQTLFKHDWIVLNFYKCLGNEAAEAHVKIQNDVCQISM